MEDALGNGLGDNLSEFLCDNPRERDHTTQSEIALMRHLMEEQREILNSAIQQNTQQ
jgi:hypothetical protein